MAKSKKSTRKPTVKVQDLETKADPKGGKETSTLMKYCANGTHLKEATITH